jgi:hypothetical protein
MLAADFPAGRRRAVTGPVGTRPLPHQHLRFPAALNLPSRSLGPMNSGPASRCGAFWPSAGLAGPLTGCAGVSRAAYLAHRQLTGGDQGKRRPCGDHPAGCRRLCDGHSANDGHAAITRPVTVGSATATLTAST